MPAQPGITLSGLSYTISVPGDPNVVWECRPVFWQIAADASTKFVYGQTSNGVATKKFHHIFKTRHFTVQAKIRYDGVPEPANWEGQSTNLVGQATTGKTITYSAAVDKFAYKKAVTQDFWDITISGTCGEPTYSAGWGTQKTQTTLSAEQIRQYGGTSFTYDANELLIGARLVVVWYTGTTQQTDANLKTAVQTAASTWVASGFDSSLKQRPTEVLTDAPGHGAFILNYGPRTTIEDYTLPASAKHVDPSGIDDFQRTSAFADSLLGAADDTTLSNAGTDYVSVTSGKTQSIRTYRKLTNEERIEYRGTRDQADPFGNVPDGTNPIITTDVFNIDTILGQTAPDICNKLVSSLNSSTSSAPWSLATGTLLNKQKGMRQIGRPHDDKKIIRELPVTRRERRACQVLGTVVTVQVPQALVIDSTHHKAYISHYDLQVTRQIIVYRRWRYCDNEADWDAEVICGMYNASTENSSLFLGKQANTFVYHGSRISDNWGKEGTNRWIRYDYVFERVWQIVNVGGTPTMYPAHFNDGNIPMDCPYESALAKQSSPTPLATQINANWQPGGPAGSVGWATAFTA